MNPFDDGADAVSVCSSNGSNKSRPKTHPPDADDAPRTFLRNREPYVVKRQRSVRRPAKRASKATVPTAGASKASAQAVVVPPTTKSKEFPKAAISKEAAPAASRSKTPSKAGLSPRVTAAPSRAQSKGKASRKSSPPKAGPAGAPQSKAAPAAVPVSQILSLPMPSSKESSKEAPRTISESSKTAPSSQRMHSKELDDLLTSAGGSVTELKDKLENDLHLVLMGPEEQVEDCSLRMSDRKQRGCFYSDPVWHVVRVVSCPHLSKRPMHFVSRCGFQAALAKIRTQKRPSTDWYLVIRPISRCGEVHTGVFYGSGLFYTPSCGG